MARTGSPSPTAVRAKTSRLTPNSSGRRARTRLAAGSIRSLSIWERAVSRRAGARLLVLPFFSSSAGAQTWPPHSPNGGHLARRTRHAPGGGHPAASPAADNRWRHLLFQVDFAQGGEELGGGGQRRALEPLHAGADQGAARVVVERHPGPVVEQALLGVLIELHAGGPRRHRIGLLEQAVELRAAIAGDVPDRAHVARVEEHGEEVLGVQIGRAH